ncbi:MAG: hypoxanthine phosphoribosyltransferase [Thermodesulfobacteriota bacterium]
MEKELIIAGQDIKQRVQELGREISAEAIPNLLVVAILKGAFIFAADLVRALSIPLEVDFIRVASYGANTCSSGEIRLSKDLETSVVGKNVLLVEDIVDTGQTIAWLKEHLRGRGAASIRTCTLIDKRERRVKEVEIDYYGFQLQKGFLVGYGLDYAEQYRHLPDIYDLKGC